MKQILVLHLNQGEETSTVSFLGQDVQVQRIGCGGDVARAQALIAEHDGRVDAIGLEGMPFELRLGGLREPHAAAATLRASAKVTPLVDGRNVGGTLERWGIALADRAQPGIFAEKRVLLVPGLNHGEMIQGLSRHTPSIRYADRVVYAALPDFPGGGGRKAIRQFAPMLVEPLRDAPFRRITPQPGKPGVQRATKPFEWADVLAGDIGAIRRYAPPNLKHKTIVVEWATEEDLADLKERQAAIVVTLMPALDGRERLGRWSAATVEAVLTALRSQPDLPLSENTYLELTAELDWKPYVRYLQPEEAEINRFAFVIHPLDASFISHNKRFRWTRFLPTALLETVAAYSPPIYLSRIRGGQSPTTGQKIEGILITLGGTPRQLLKHSERFTYNRLNTAARMSERMGARLMGLGAFTKVVGDAGITVANEADIAITSGNSLTVVATLESAKIAVTKMGGTDPAHGNAMVIGATGAIGSVCSRLLAQAVKTVALVSIEPEKLIELKRKIQEETPTAEVVIATRPDTLIGACDLIVTTTSAFGQRIMDISKCKPGAVVCDVARPADISPAEAALRPDVLVIESGEVIIPGDVDFGFDIGLPPKVAYACLAEAALLAMEGRFEDYTLGRNIKIEQVNEIHRLFTKHQFQIAGLTTFGKYLTDEQYARKRSLAQKLRDDPELFARVQAEAEAKLSELPVQAKGTKAGGGRKTAISSALGAGAALVGDLVSWGRRPQRRAREEEQ